jgi:uncharacterized membrane protein YdfJ with MMPL/SSD domain
MLGSLTFLPAMLSFLSQKNWLEKDRVPYITKRRHKAKGESRVWGATVTRVLERPLASTLIAGGLLLASASPRSASSSRNRASTATRAASRSSRPATGSRPRSPATPFRPRP